MRVWCIVCCAILLAAPASAWAADYFPVSLQVIRNYDRDGQDPYSTFFVAPPAIESVPKSLLRFVGGVDDGLYQYWIENDEKDKFFEGYYSQPTGLSVQYFPPILWIDAPLSVGKTWDVTVEAIPYGFLTLRFAVTGFGPVTVPAGTFDAFTINVVALNAPKLPMGLTGLAEGVALSKTGDDYVYADGVGLIHELSSGITHRLLSIETQTSVSPVTWGRVRALFR